MCNLYSLSNGSQTFSWENYVVFLSLFCLLAKVSLFPPCPTGKTLEIVHLPRGRSWRPGHSFFSVRFVKIIPIMILLATGRMWLLKMDLWKNSYPQKNTGRWMNPNPHPLLHRTYSLCKFNSRGYICVLKANKSESHNPRPQVPLHVPSRLLSWNFEIAEAELIWQGINLPQHLQSLYPAIAWPIEIQQQQVTRGKEVQLLKSRKMSFNPFETIPWNKMSFFLYVGLMNTIIISVAIITFYLLQQ